MNYLAHILIAHETDTHIVGNFMGDFVKGSDLSGFAPDIIQAIRLHRAVDSYTDSHSQVRELAQSFPTNIRRYAGICLDVYFDHLLIKHWQSLTCISFDKLLLDFYSQLDSVELPDSNRFERVKMGLLDYQWLIDYRYIEGVSRALTSIESRFKRRQNFANDAIEFLQQNQQVEQGFLLFMPELISFAKQQVKTA